MSNADTGSELAGCCVQATVSATPWGIGRVNPAEMLKLPIDDVARHTLYRRGDIAERALLRLRTRDAESCRHLAVVVVAVAVVAAVRVAADPLRRLLLERLLDRSAPSGTSKRMGPSAWQAALSTFGREGLAGLVTVRPLADPTAGRMVAVFWRRTDPRGAEVLGFAALLRDRLPDDVLSP